MSYIGNFVFNLVANQITEKHPNVLVSSEYTETPASFPAVTVIQSDNAEYEAARTVYGETAQRLLYEVRVYTNTVGTKQAEAYKIMETADAAMTGKTEIDGQRLGFRRTMCSPIPNLNDSTIFALVARYQGVNKPETDGENTIHRIYTK